MSGLKLIEDGVKYLRFTNDDTSFVSPRTKAAAANLSSERVEPLTEIE
jgi:hypothetical protein